MGRWAVVVLIVNEVLLIFLVLSNSSLELQTNPISLLCCTHSGHSEGTETKHHKSYSTTILEK